jgi:hypothetical protein
VGPASDVDGLETKGNDWARDQTCCRVSVKELPARVVSKGERYPLGGDGHGVGGPASDSDEPKGQRRPSGVSEQLWGELCTVPSVSQRPAGPAAPREEFSRVCEPERLRPAGNAGL